MNETAEILEYLRIVEMKLSGLIRDIRNIRDRLEPKTQSTAPTFFDVLKADDDTGHTPRM